MIKHFSVVPLLMGRLGWLLLGTFLAIAAIVSGNAAAADGRARLMTYNSYPNRSMWVTIYDLGKTRHLDYGCVEAKSQRSWESGNYAYGSFYYIRAEVKEAPACGGRTLCDTSIQVNPQYPGYIFPEAVGQANSDPVTLIPNGDNCYFRKGDHRSPGAPSTPQAPTPNPPGVAPLPVPAAMPPPPLANISISGGVAPATRRLLSVTADGNQADLYITDDGSGRQRFRLQLSADRATYNIVVLGGVRSGRQYLSTTGDGTRVDLYTSDDGSGRQRWRLQLSADRRSYNILVAGGVSGGRRYLSTTGDGTRVDLYTSDDGSGRQRWTFTPR
jgi:hypothetical protein